MGLFYLSLEHSLHELADELGRAALILQDVHVRDASASGTSLGQGHPPAERKGSEYEV